MTTASGTPRPPAQPPSGPPPGRRRPKPRPARPPRPAPRPASPPPSQSVDLLDDIDVMLEGAQAWATFLPESADRIEVCGQEILRHRLRMARRAVADLLAYGSGRGGEVASASPRPVDSSRPREEVRAGRPPQASGADFKLPTPPFVLGVGVPYDVLPPVDDRPYRERVPWPGRPFPVYELRTP